MGAFLSGLLGGRSGATAIEYGLIAALIVIEAPGPAVDTWVSGRSVAVLVAIGLGLATAVLAVLWLQLRSEVRTLSAQLNSARRIAMTAPPGRGAWGRRRGHAPCRGGPPESR